MRRWFLEPERSVSGESAAVFRVAFGVVGFLIAARYLAYGWVDQLLVSPGRHFTYPGFAWVTPWPEPWMSIHIGVMGVAALCVALGWRYRFALSSFFILFAYLEAIDRTLYINHYYWIGLTAFVMLFLPLNRTWSLDAKQDGWRPLVPIAAVWLLRFQVGFVYVFAGIAKLNTDWLFRGEPLATWLGARTDLPALGPLLGSSEFAVALSWAGALFDLTIVGWMLWRRSRPFAYGAAVGFHLVTWLLFPSIGLFPLIMSVSLLVFFRPAWPSFVWSRIRGMAPRPAPIATGSTPRWNRPMSAVLAAYVIAMVLIPLRSLANDDVLRSGEGYQFGWRVMLTEKSGTVDFVVTDPGSGATWVVDGPEGLTMRQDAVMATDATLIRQAASMVESDLAAQGFEHLEVRAESYLSFNGRPNERFIDPTIDLTNPSDPRPLVISAP